MHAAVYAYIGAAVTRYGPFRRVVEVGSKDVNGSIRPYFLGADYTGLDLAPGRGVNVVADGAEWFPDEPVDCVVTCETLEHSDHADQIVANALGMLGDGGYLLLTAAGPERAPHSGVDGQALRPGEHYAGVDPEQLRDWLATVDVLDLSRDPAHGDVYAIARKP